MFVQDCGLAYLGLTPSPPFTPNPPELRKVLCHSGSKSWSLCAPILTYIPHQVKFPHGPWISKNSVCYLHDLYVPCMCGATSSHLALNKNLSENLAKHRRITFYVIKEILCLKPLNS